MNNSNRRTANVFFNHNKSLHVSTHHCHHQYCSTERTDRTKAIVLTEIISSMSVVCEWIDWLIAVAIWGCCNKSYGVLTVHTLHSVHTVHTVTTVHTVYSVHTVHTLRTVFNVRTVHTVHTVYREPTVRSCRHSKLEVCTVCVRSVFVG
jgi:hypothetical protein